MKNNFLTKDYSNRYSINIPSKTNIVVPSNVAVYNKYAKSVSNNFRICKWLEYIDCEETSVPTGNVVVQVDPANHLLNKTLKLTYETLYQNIASLDNHTDMRDPRYFIRTYYLDNSKTITVITNMRDLGVIVSTISGDTGFDKVLVKTTTYVKNSNIDVTYTYGDNND